MEATLAESLKQEARRIGFAAAGIAGVEPFDTARERALQAVEAGRMDGMPWFTAERVRASADLGARYPWARSIVSLAWPYARAPRRGVDPDGGPLRGRMSAYACLACEAGDAVDYHRLLADGCRALIAWLRERRPELRAKHFVDHGWALDRAVAERAGLGFSGKNTMLITAEAGSYVLLAEILVSVDLPADRPSRRSCGSCRACLPACPTGALVGPGVIDAPRCIAYLTIEHRGPIPVELRPLIGDWVFGCDLCQEACPINDRLAPARDPGADLPAHGPVPYPDLVECLRLSDAEFEARFGRSAVARAGREGLARNCAVALGNRGDRRAIPALLEAERHDPDATVREAAAWALSRLGETAI